jgi:hypothetical protein
VLKSSPQVGAESILNEILARAAVMAVTVVIQKAGGPATVLRADGTIQEYNPENTHIPELQNPSTIYLFEACLPRAQPLTVPAFTVVVTPPDRDRYSNLRHSRRVIKRWVYPFSEAEMEAAMPFIGCGVAWGEVRERFRAVGGNMDVLVAENQDIADDRIQAMVEACRSCTSETLKQWIVSIRGETDSAGIQHHVIRRLRPSCCGDTHFDTAMVRFSSPVLEDIVVSRVRQEPDHDGAIEKLLSRVGVYSSGTCPFTANQSK